jgi:autotransporter passenger strand-loop-strand repeat protein/autotransporter-associated beta strand protein
MVTVNETITFDDLADGGTGTQIPNGYDYLNWNNFYILNTPASYNNYAASGYINGTVSAPNVAFNAYGNPPSFSALSGSFTLDSFYLTAAWYDGLNVLVEGLKNGVVVDSATLVVNTGGPTLETLNWSGINQVYFASSGGTQNLNFSGSGEHFALDNLTVTLNLNLFTTGADTVDFNNLTTAQRAAIAGGADIYHGLGGSDLVTLPNEANYNESVGNGQTLGWTDTAASTFYTGSQAGDTYTVNGGDGSYNIVEGAGTEFVTINGDGDSNITAGSGTDTISITGNGDTIITAGTGTAAVSIAGSGDNTADGNLTGSASITGGGSVDITGTFNGSATVGSGSTLELDGASTGGPITFGSGDTGETLEIDGTTMPTNVISGFVQGDTIDLANVSYVSGGSAILQSFGGGAQANVLTITENGTSYNLQLHPSQSFAGDEFVLASDGNGGTNITIQHGFDLNLTFEQSLNELSSNTGFIQGVDAAAQIIDNTFTNPITVNIEIGYGDVPGSATPLDTTSAKGAPGSVKVTYPFLRSLLINHGDPAASLPNTLTLGGQLFFWIGSAQAKALGIINANNSAEDGVVGIGTQVSSLYLKGLALHEITHAMGRITGSTSELFSLDLFRYSSAGALQFNVGNVNATPSIPALPSYFSLDGGITKLADFGQNSDPGDFLNAPPNYPSSPLTPNDPFDEFYTPTTSQGLTPLDITTMDVLGFTSVPNAGLIEVSPPATTSVSIGQTLNVGVGQLISGLVDFFGGVVNVQSGGSVIDAEVYGDLNILSGGTADPTTIYSGGVEVISGGGTDSGAVIAGGQQDVYGSAISAAIYFGSQVVEAGGVATYTTVWSGGTLYVLSNGVVEPATIYSGGLEVVSAGGSDSGALISGGEQDLYGSAVGATVFAGSQVVENGGIASGTVVSSGAQEDVYSGGVADGTVVSSGSSEYIYGGIASGTVVSSGGYEYDYGTASGTVVLSGGSEQVWYGATANGPVVSSGGNEYVYGTASDASIDSGGALTVFDGGMLSGTITDNGTLAFDLNSSDTFAGTLTGSGSLVVSGGGTLIMSGGDAFTGSTTISGGTLELTSAGAAGTGPITFNPNGTESLQIDGTTMPTNIISGFAVGDTIDLAGVTFSSGGSAVLGSGGVVTVTEGGQTYTLDFDPTQDFANEPFTVSADGADATDVFLTLQVLSSAYTVASGQTVSNVTVINGGDLILAGGTAIDTVVSTGGVEQVWYGGVASGTVVSSGGYEYVYGTASGTIVSSGGTLFVDSGGVASGTVVSSGGSIELALTSADVWSPNDANIIDGVTIQSGAIVSLDIYSGGSISGFVVSSGGAETVYDGGVAAGTQVNSGVENVQPAGVVNGTVLSSGGTEYVYGTASGIVVSNGGQEDVEFGGVAGGTVVNSGGGDETVWSGGVASGTVISSGGVENIQPGGIASDTVVSSGGNEYVYGTASGTVVSSGGTIALPLTSAYGAWNAFGTNVVDGVTIQSGAIVDFTIDQGGSISGFVLLSGGGDVVYSGGVVSSTVVSSGGYEEIYSGGVASGTVVSNGGVEAVQFGGVVNGTVVDGGGNESVYGIASGTIVSSGGALFSYSGGVASGTVLSSGGVVIVYNGGVASGTVISSGDQENVGSAGTASDATVDSGGTLTVFDGGTLTGNIINNGTLAFDLYGSDTFAGTLTGSGSLAVSGGSTLVMSGGDRFTGDATISDGTLELGSATAVGTGPITFAAGSEDPLRIDGTTMPANVISGFTAGDTVDLPGVTFSSGASATLGAGNVVTITDGGNSYQLDFDPNQSFAETFVVYADGSGGAELGLNVPPVLSSVYTVASGQSVSDVTVVNGGDLILSGGTASDTIVSSGGTLDVLSGGLADPTIIYAFGQEVVSAGGIDNGALISGGDQDVYGSAVGATVFAGAQFLFQGVQIVESGGVASGTVVNSDGVQYVYGSASGTVVSSGGNEYIESGGVASGTVVKSGGSEDVVYGGVASGTVVSSGGTIDLPLTSAYGVWSPIVTTVVIDGVTIQSGAIVDLTIDQGGSISGFIVASGGNESIDSGGVAGGTVISSDGSESVSSGGIANGTVVGSGGDEYVFYGGVASGTVVSSGGQQFVENSPPFPFGSGVGTAIDTVIGSGARQYVYGSASGTVVSSGGQQFVESSTFPYGSDVGIAIDTVVGSGAQQYVYGSASGTVVSSGGQETVEGSSFFGGGGAATDTIVNGGGTVIVDAGATLGGTVVDNGTLIFDLSGSETFSGTLTGSGVLIVEGGGTLVMSGGDAFTGDVTIRGGTLELGSATAAGMGPITFAPESDGTLQIDGPNAAGNLLPGDTISGFVPGDTIDLTGTSYDSAGSANLDPPTNVLAITENGETYDLQLDPSQDFSGDYFHLSPDSGMGTDITENTPPCYCRGTLIRTGRGQKRVEKLKIGDMVMTVSGVARPVKWIGRRSYGGRFIKGRKDILPVCIKAGALDDNVPRRDLWISPHHAMYLEGVLIEARDLVNGVSIMQSESTREVEYFHVELETHDVIIAEGAPSETFIDDDDRLMFHNAPEYYALYPNERAAPARYCAPRCEDGYEVEAARRRIARRAGLRSGREPRIGMLRGFVDLVAPRCIAGWAQNADYLEAPVCLDILAGGRLIGQTLANRYREDLERAGLGSGRHSFEFTPPVGLGFAPDAVQVRRSLDGAVLTLSGHVTEAADARPASRRRRRKVGSK